MSCDGSIYNLRALGPSRVCFVSKQLQSYCTVYSTVALSVLFNIESPDTVLFTIIHCEPLINCSSSDFRFRRCTCKMERVVSSSKQQSQPASPAEQAIETV